MCAYVMLELGARLPLDTPRGRAWCWAVTDRSQEHDLEFHCFLRDTGESWTFRSCDVRLAQNLTMGVRRDGPYVDSRGTVHTPPPPTEKGVRKYHIAAQVARHNAGLAARSQPLGGPSSGPAAPAGATPAPAPAAAAGEPLQPAAAGSKRPGRPPKPGAGR